MWKDYTKWKQNYSEIAEKYWKSVQKIFDENINIQKEYYNNSLIPQKTVIVADCTFFWPRWETQLWIIVLKSFELWKILYSKEIWTETIEEYEQAIEYIKNKWWIVIGLVTDGKTWIINKFNYMPVQLCQFHKVKNILKYTTRKPRTEAWKHLKKIILNLINCDYEVFKFWIEIWHIKHENFLKERTYNEVWKWCYTHKRLRWAYRSIATNMKYLFTYQNNDFKMPNTTNSLDWYFSMLKTKIWLHRWLRKDRKLKRIFEYFK